MGICFLLEETVPFFLDIIFVVFDVPGSFLLLYRFRINVMKPPAADEAHQPNSDLQYWPIRDKLGDPTRESERFTCTLVGNQHEAVITVTRTNVRLQSAGLPYEKRSFAPQATRQ